MDNDRCVDEITHAGCTHPGWRESTASGAEEADAAEAAAYFASRDLKLDTIRVRFFEPGPPFVINLTALGDVELVRLHQGKFDPCLRGTPCDPAITPRPTLWVRHGLSPTLTAAVVLHEARHIWYYVSFDASNPPSLDDEEIDTKRYMWEPLRLLGFTAEEIDAAYQESQNPPM
jgi:hypothetical protein